MYIDITLTKKRKRRLNIMYILCGLESDWLRRSIWGGIFLCSSHSNPINFLKYWLKKKYSKNK